MSDLISRADAIEELCTMMVDCFDADEEVIDAIRTTINEISSAETHEIRTETHGVCLISKDDAMGAVQDHFNADGFKGYDDGQKMMDRINALPSAEAVSREEYDALYKRWVEAEQMVDYYDIDGDDDMAIDALSSDAVQGWIPCSERLPKEYAQYLVCFESGHCYVYWLEDSDWARGMAEKEGIIAWMPLPKPYREDGEA